MDVAPSLTKLVARLKSDFKGRARVDLSIQEPLPPVRVDRARMQEAVTNLVKNAVEAIFERWGDSAGRRGRVTIAAKLSSGREVMLLCVADNGPGIPAVSVQEVCRAGFTTKPGGSGLGLAITRRIVADHGGVLEVESSPEKGACFTIRLPLQVESRPATGGIGSGPVVLSEPDALLVDELA
jgi:signal transduction histidine kinase